VRVDREGKLWSRLRHRLINADSTEIHYFLNVNVIYFPTTMTLNTVNELCLVEHGTENLELYS
jgi:hypothetical protein